MLHTVFIGVIRILAAHRAIVKSIVNSRAISASARAYSEIIASIAAASAVVVYVIVIIYCAGRMIRVVFCVGVLTLCTRIVYGNTALAVSVLGIEDELGRVVVLVAVAPRVRELGDYLCLANEYAVSIEVTGHTSDLSVILVSYYSESALGTSNSVNAVIYAVFIGVILPALLYGTAKGVIKRLILSAYASVNVYPTVSAADAVFGKLVALKGYAIVVIV